MCDVAEVALFAIQNSAILVHKKQVRHLHYERERDRRKPKEVKDRKRERDACKSNG